MIFLIPIEGKVTAKKAFSQGLHFFHTKSTLFHTIQSSWVLPSNENNHTDWDSLFRSPQVTCIARGAKPAAYIYWNSEPELDLNDIHEEVTKIGHTYQTLNQLTFQVGDQDNFLFASHELIVIWQPKNSLKYADPLYFLNQGCQFVLYLKSWAKIARKGFLLGQRFLLRRHETRLNTTISWRTSYSYAFLLRFVSLRQGPMDRKIPFFSFPVYASRAMHAQRLINIISQLAREEN